LVFNVVGGFILRMTAVEIFVDDFHIGNIGANGHALLALRPGNRVVKAACGDSYPLPILFFELVLAICCREI